MKLLGLCLLSFSLLSGCATVHSGKYAIEDTKKKGASKSGVARRPIVISGEENRALSSEHFTSFDLTFENTTSKWIRIKEAYVDFGSAEANEKVRVVVGSDLQAWSEAAQMQAAINSYNTSMIMGAVAAAGAVAATASSDPKVRTLGGLAAVGGGTALSVSAIKDRLSDIRKLSLVPDTHLYSPNFIVPPKLFTKKWFAIYTEDSFAIPYIQQIVVNYVTESGQTETATIPIRTYKNPSDWQEKHPEIDVLRKAANPPAPPSTN